MIFLINKPKNTFPELKKSLFQKCHICKSELAIDSIWDIDAHELTYVDCCGEPWLKVDLSVNCPNCHHTIYLNGLNSYRYLKTLKKSNIEPEWIEKYRQLTPLNKSISESIAEIKLSKDLEKSNHTIIILSENLFTLARFVRTFNFPDVKLFNGEYDPDFERFCAKYDNGDITSSKEAYDYLIEIYNLKRFVK